MDCNLSIVVPTCGRSTLRRTLFSLRRQLGPCDTVLVIGDGPQPVAERIVSEWSDPRLQYQDGPRSGFYGCAQRNHAYRVATGTHFAFCDDDDVMTADALQHIRDNVRRTPDRPLLFRIRETWGRGALIWRKLGRALEGNVAGAGLVVRNDPARLALWPETPEACRHKLQPDVTMIEDTIRNYGGAIEYVDQVIVNTFQRSFGATEPVV